MTFVPLGPLWDWLKDVAGRLSGECEKERRQLRDDIAELKMEMAAMLAELTTLRKLQQIGTVFSDHRGNITRVSPTLNDMTGFVGDELVGKHITMLMPYRYRRDHDAAFSDVVDGTRFLRDDPYEVELIRKDSSLLQVLISLSIVSGPGEPPIFRADIRRRW